MRSNRSWVFAGSLAATAFVCSARADADGAASRVGIGVEVGAAHMLDASNRSLFGFGMVGALQLEINPHPLIGLHIGGDVAWLSSDQSPSTATWYGGRAGLRFHWGYLLNRHSASDGWIDAHYAFGASGSVARSGFDAGLGYEIGLVHGFRLGPFARVQWASDPRGEDPILFALGLSIGILGDRADVPDSDRDGVDDAHDVCPNEPAGATPDATRRGCPARDSDGDGVFDPQDVCPTVPAGAHPDPSRRGCPALDTDGDGVVDASDVCPTTPAGAHPDPARAGCPASDQDGDGVFDRDDVCPTVPAGARPDPHRPGCPIGDRDADSIPDDVDHCPDQPGAPSTDPARNGCPGLVRVAQQQIQILRPVFFATGRETILDESFPVLAAVADALQALGLPRVRVEGHTDNRGNAARNLRLSQRRADSVMRWLVEHGVPASSIEAQGFGDTRPVETNTTPLGRAANRRVEFHFVSGANAEPTPTPAASPAPPAPTASPAPSRRGRHRH